MSQDSFEPAVKFTAPTPEQTTISEVATQPTSAEQEPPEQQEPKVFTQEEVDRIAAKERAAERRRYERELRERHEAAQQPVYTERPKREHFRDEESYSDALADFKVAQRDQQKQLSKVESTYEQRAEAAREKYDDFDTVIQRSPAQGGPAISELMALAIKESEIGPDIAYHLAKNPAESRRIYDLNPVTQAREIGKIEAKLLADPPVKKASSAPDPITPVSTRSASPNYSASDPRSLKMSMDDWAASRMKERTKSR